MPVPKGPLAVFEELHLLLDGLGAAHAVIGGWAAIAWGSVRTTRDIDLLLDAPTRLRGRLEKTLAEAGFSFEWRPGGQDDPIALMLRLERQSAAGAIPVDCLICVNPVDAQALARRVRVPLGGWEVPVLRAEDLIAMKLAAGSPLDLADARGVFSSAGPALDAVMLEEACRRRRCLSALRSLRAP